MTKANAEGHPCTGFEMDDAKEVLRHFEGNLEVVEDYGSSCNGHQLHTWDDGGRVLLRCKACGGYLLRQDSEFHGFESDDAYYTDYFPVSGPEEAGRLNAELDGWQIERRFGRRYLLQDDLAAPRWSDGR